MRGEYKRIEKMDRETVEAVLELLFRKGVFAKGKVWEANEVYKEYLIFTPYENPGGVFKITIDDLMNQEIPPHKNLKRDEKI